MSGISSRVMYDECYSKQINTLNENKMNYSMFLDSYVNTSFEKPTECTDKNNCNTCMNNKEATFTNLPTDFAKRTEIENSLLGITNNISACQLNSTEMKSNISSNPRLCERNITPTNMSLLSK